MSLSLTSLLRDQCFEQLGPAFKYRELLKGSIFLKKDILLFQERFD